MITSVTEGQNATLNVSLTSQSSLISEFTWFRPNLIPVNITANDGKYKVETIGSQSILSISNLTVNDNGTYTCTARNIIGSTTFNFTLDVKSQGTNGSNDSGGSSGLSGGAIAGIVIGVLAGVALIGVGGFFLRSAPTTIVGPSYGLHKNLCDMLPALLGERDTKKFSSCLSQTIMLIITLPVLFNDSNVLYL
ncbi:hypothetical protein AB205_0182240 [Aquarana catesbeiana]|uniref:Ig-like domain-containing protein n=1 Tax=Aquarana catesbeiana TaxID=8400 RepID=A0A2G9SC77_AQUCT|nr:hypothetical protein AB205_0182240 [Aquarana catesbeiana]